MKKLSDKLQTISHEQYQESTIYNSSLKKVLKLFGYSNSFNNYFLRRIKGPINIIDIHKFETLIADKHIFIMCIVYDANRDVESGILVRLKKQYNSDLTISTFKESKTINDIVNQLKMIDINSEIILNYE